MTDFRALCAELLDEFVYHTDWSDAEELKERARAALAEEPAVPEGREPASVAGQPSDEELLNFARNQEPWKTWLHPGGCLESAHCEVADLLSAVLARWGNPAPAPPADGEVAELVAWLEEEADDYACIGNTDAASKCNRAADLLQHLSPPQPVPVSERLPEAKDCDDQKRCWWLVHQSWPCLYLMKADSGLAAAVATHWLPAHALPLPGQEVEG